MILLNRLLLASMLFLAASAEAYGWLRPRCSPWHLVLIF
jgi:hypothetical protein